MAKAKKTNENFLAITLALFFIILGLLGIIPNVDESIFALKSGLTLDVIFGIVELAAGFILLLSMFTLIDKKVLRVAGYLILIFWIARIILSKVVSGIPLYYPTIMTWLLILMVELIIASGIFALVKKIEK